MTVKTMGAFSWIVNGNKFKFIKTLYMGIINFSIPKDIVIKIVNNIQIENFIETGTFMGGTAFWAASYFTNIYTIEIDEEISKKTASNPECPKNVNFIVGDSKYALNELMPKIEGRSFFWLDGHWCTGGGGKDAECPLIDELKALKNLKDPIIFIDDARCFLGPLPKPHRSEDWPLIDEIFSTLKELFPNHFTTIQDDVIMCVPTDVRSIINEDWQEKFSLRFNPPKPVTNNIKKSKWEIFKSLFK